MSWTACRSLFEPTREPRTTTNRYDTFVRLAPFLLVATTLVAVMPIGASTVQAQEARSPIERAVDALLQPPSPEEAQDAARLLAGLGGAVLPVIEEALTTASWHGRAALVAAVAEMDTPRASEVLLRASRDRSFAVREAAAIGIGKIGDGRAAEVLLELGSPATESVWRVRAAAATALRRAVLRGVLDRRAAEHILVAQLADPDPDARRAALRAVVPLGIDSALPAVRAIYNDREADSTDRALALYALRVYVDRPDDVLPTLRRGLLESDDPEAAAAAGAALLDVGGAAQLADEQVGRAVLRQLGDAGAPALRAALGRLGPDAVPWLRAHANEVAERIARRRVEHRGSPLELIIEALLEIRREEAFLILRDLAVGPNAEIMAPDTREFALRKIQLRFAPRLADELRAAYDSHAGDGVRRELLLAIEASGGDDLAARLDAALAHDDGQARWAALDLLKRRPDLAAGPVLSKLASDDKTPRTMREQALETLARRAPDEAADVARSLLDHGHYYVRVLAAELLARAARQADAPVLLARLEAEEGTDSRDGTRAVDDGAAVTPTSPNRLRTRRRRVLKAVLSALRECNEGDARDTYLAILRDEPDADVREAAARLLRGIATLADAEALLAFHDAETSPETQRALLATLVTLDGAPNVTARFEAMLASPSRRLDALNLLRAKNSRVRPGGLEAGLTDKEWSDEEREAALVLLDRQGRPPTLDLLISLVHDAHDKGLVSEALRVLAETGGARAGDLLVGLVADLDDADKLALVIEQLGRVRFEPAVPLLIGLADAWRGAALRATLSSEAVLEVYRRAVIALGRCGTEAAGRALARHLLDGVTAHAVHPYSVERDGPFKRPRRGGAPPVRAVRALVSALAHFGEGECRALIVQRLEQLSAEGGLFALPEAYLDGVARYLRDPEAYELPARRRPAAALPLMRRVLATAPRLSKLDVEMQRFVAEQLENEKRFPEAAQAYREAIALADVEEGWRSPERRLAERGKLELLVALGDAGAGRIDDAAARLAALRDPAPSDGALAYYEGYGRAKIGLADATARDALQQTLAVDERHARAHLWLGWVDESLEDRPAALRHYAEALRLDRRRVTEAGGEYLTHRRGRVHRWSSYPYWYARALARAGDDGDSGLAYDLLHEAILRDDRSAAQALADPAFQAWSDLGDLVAYALGAIPDSD